MPPNNQPEVRKNYLIKEERDEHRIEYWVEYNSTFDEADKSIHLAWHPTWIVGAISEEDYQIFLRLCSKHNQSQTDHTLSMYQHDQIDKFLTQCESKLIDKSNNPDTK